jgi:glyoxylate utilization-related uncharacterized protein
VLEGELHVRIADAESTVRAGETVDVPPGTPHAMWNAVPQPARALWQTRPALKTEGFFELIWGLAQAAHAGQEGPSGDEVAALMREYSDEFRLGRPDTG